MEKIFEDWCPKCTFNALGTCKPCMDCAMNPTGREDGKPVNFLEMTEASKEVVARYELWCSNCVYRRTNKSAKPCRTCAMVQVNEYLKAPLRFREAVRYDIYCSMCKHKLKGMHDKPCEECILKSTSYRPINYEPDIKEEE